MSEQSSMELRAFAEDHLWVSEHLESLLDEYAEQWVAVKNRRAIGSDVDLMRLRERVTDPAHICMEFVTCEPLGMLSRPLRVSSEGDSISRQDAANLANSETVGCHCSKKT